MISTPMPPTPTSEVHSATTRISTIQSRHSEPTEINHFPQHAHTLKQTFLWVQSGANAFWHQKIRLCMLFPGGILGLATFAKETTRPEDQGSQKRKETKRDLTSSLKRCRSFRYVQASRKHECSARAEGPEELELAKVHFLSWATLRCKAS